MEGGDQYYPTQKDHQDPLSCQNPSNKKKSANTKRFSEEQIKSLESMFTLETKLEAHQKLKLARDLGLQPRQVGIWFQNKRARWKSKQIEQDYRALKAEFDSLNLQFDYLKKENESLLMQLEKLRCELENTPDGHKTSQDSKGSDIFTNLDNKDANFVIKENPGCLNGGAENKMENNDILGMNKCLELKEETEFLKMGELGDCPLSSQEKWCCIGLGEAFYHSCGTSKWWDI